MKRRRVSLGKTTRPSVAGVLPRKRLHACEYQMHTPIQGAGRCSFSNGARYKVHIGN